MKSAFRAALPILAVVLLGTAVVTIGGLATDQTGDLSRHRSAGSRCCRNRGGPASLAVHAVAPSCRDNRDRRRVYGQ